MVRTIVLGAFLLALISAPVHAQPSDGDQRRTHVFEDYLETVTASGPQLTSLHIAIILAEVNARFADVMSLASYELLRAAFNVLYADFTPSGYGYLPHQEDWERAMLLAHLREHSVDLAGVEAVRFGDYDILITPVDFSGGPASDYVLDAVRGCAYPPCRPAAFQVGSADYQELLVVEQDRHGKLRIVATPLPWLSQHYRYSSSQGSSLVPLRFTDIDKDGRPEWLVMSLFYAGRNATGVRLYVLGWRDGQLVDLSEEPISYEDYYGFGDFDQLEAWTLTETTPPTLVQRVPAQDNWRCEREDITEYVWNGDRFEQHRQQILLDDTFECLVRQAEAATYEHDYQVAISLYEQAFALGDKSVYEDYAIIRLALAYALVDEVDTAVALLTDLQAREPEVNAGNALQLLGAMLSHSPYSRIQLCLRAYNFVVGNPLYVPNAFSILPGRIDEHLIFDQYPNLGSPLRVGCDVDWLIDQTIGKATYTATLPPADQIRRMGWPLTATQGADLNSDGTDDWLVWIDSEMLHPLLFVSDGEQYVYSRFVPSGRDERYPNAPGSNYEVSGVVLPNGTTAIAVLDRVVTHPYLERINRDMGGGPSCANSPGSSGQPPRYPGELRVYTLNAEMMLEPFFRTFVCEAGAVADFVRDRTVVGWDEPRQDGSYLTQHTYTWDDQAEKFSRPPVPTPTELPPVESRSPSSILHDATREFVNGDASTALANVDRVLESQGDLDADQVLASRYLRALALEKLNRPIEALAEYVTIIEAAPETTWAMFAATKVVSPRPTP